MLTSQTSHIVSIKYNLGSQSVTAKSTYRHPFYNGQLKAGLENLRLINLES